MHEEAIRAAKEAWLTGRDWQSIEQKLTAAITAFLGHVKVSPNMQDAGQRAVDLLPPYRTDEESVAFRAMLAQLAREL